MNRTFSSGRWVTKGCYIYTNGKYVDDIFYGLGGSFAQTKSHDMGYTYLKRPQGFDCITGATMFYINLYPLVVLLNV